MNDMNFKICRSNIFTAMMIFAWTGIVSASEQVLPPQICQILTTELSKKYDDTVAPAKKLAAMFNDFIDRTTMERVLRSQSAGEMSIDANWTQALQLHLAKNASWYNYTECPGNKVPVAMTTPPVKIIQAGFTIGNAGIFISDEEFSTNPTSTSKKRGIYFAEDTNLNFIKLRNLYGNKFSLSFYKALYYQNKKEASKSIKNDDHNCDYSADFNVGINMMCAVPGTDSTRTPVIQTPYSNKAEPAVRSNFLKLVDATITHNITSGIGTFDSTCRKKFSEAIKDIGIPQEVDFNNDTSSKKEQFIQGCITDQRKIDGQNICFELGLKDLANIKRKITWGEILYHNNIEGFDITKAQYLLNKLEGQCASNMKNLKKDIRRTVKDLAEDPQLADPSTNRHPFFDVSQ